MFAENAKGMTLRDYFAAKAMRGLIGTNQGDSIDLAAKSYSIADIMLIERDKEPTA